MTCIVCDADDHEAGKCPERSDSLLETLGVRRVTDEKAGKLVYVATGDEGDVQALDVVELPDSEPGGIPDMIQQLERMKAGKGAGKVSMIDDRIAALRSLESSLGGDA